MEKFRVVRAVYRLESSPKIIRGGVATTPTCVERAAAAVCINCVGKRAWSALFTIPLFIYAVVGVALVVLLGRSEGGRDVRHRAYG